MRFTILGMVLIGVTLVGAEPNAVRNPGFEQGDAGPAEWAFNQRKTTSQIVWDRQRGRTGTASVQITNRAATETGNVVQSYRFDPPLPAGTRLTFSAFAATQDCADSPRIIMQLYSTASVRQNASATCPGGTHGFREVRGHMIVRAPSSRLAMYLCNYSLGTVWWDDAELRIIRAAALPAGPRPAGDGTTFRVRSQDGLAIDVADNGGIASVRLGTRDLAAGFGRTGLWIREVGKAALCVTGDVDAKDGMVRQRYESDGFIVEAVFQGRADCISCTGTIRDTRGTDRAVDVWFALPVGGAGWRWGTSIREETPIEDLPLGSDTTTFASVSDPGSRDGVALAVPADSPCECTFTHDPEQGFAVSFRFGLSPAAGGTYRSAAPFRFNIYRCDGRWGLRDAARRYYRMHPWAFEKRVTREGLWLFGGIPKWLPDPENYTFHEGGVSHRAYGDEHGFYTCPYIIPGQREIRRLPELPTSSAQALALLGKADLADEKRGRGWGKDMKEIIENCMLTGADGAPRLLIRNTTWGGKSVTFPLNANPALLRETEGATVAKALLQTTASWLRDAPTIDGIYVDSLGLWGEYSDHRPDHMAVTQTPLTYDGQSGKPAISNQYPLLEFLWGLRDVLHAADKVLFANGVHQTRRFHFFALDVMGVEGHGLLEQKRVMAYQKPFLLLIYNIHADPAKMAHYYHLCTFYGIYPSFGNTNVFRSLEDYAPVERLNRRFVPALRRITRAGWQPVSHVHSDLRDVWVERWGPGKDNAVYLTVYNAAQKERLVSLAIDHTSLPLGRTGLSAIDLLSGEKWQGEAKGEEFLLRLPVPGEQVRVLQLSSAAAP
ncbi:MAG: hypothetical protein HN380_15610 [Victivallales bacterium]|nr:hypothetical protein [Victivallales bacterium]